MGASVECLPLRTEGDLIVLRAAVRAAAAAIGLDAFARTRLMTAASELARNAYRHGGGGECRVEQVGGGAWPGVRLRFSDEGPGIADVRSALADGYSTGEGLGYGLGGSRRLVDEFRIDSTPGRGTDVTIVQWRRG